MNKHIVIHVNELEFEDDDDELSFDEEICFDSNSVSSVWQMNRIYYIRLINIFNTNFGFV